MYVLHCVLFCAFVALAFGFADYVPKSFYVIDRAGHKSDIVYLRNRRSVLEIIPLLRARRRASSSSGSHSSSFSSSSSGTGASDNIHFGDIPDFGGAGFPPGFQDAARQAFHDSGFGGPDGAHISVGPGPPGPVLLSRFGEGAGGNVAASGKAQGQKGSYTSSSSSVDGDGKVKYSVQAGKF